MKIEKQEDREMEMLLNEIPHATSPNLRHPPLAHDDGHACHEQHAHQRPQVHGVGGGYANGPSPVPGLCGPHGWGYGHSGGGGGGHHSDGYASPAFLSEGSSSASGSFSGTLSPPEDNGVRRSPELRRCPAHGEWTREGLALLSGVRAMSIADDREGSIRLRRSPASAFPGHQIDASLFPGHQINASLFPGHQIDACDFGNNLVAGSSLNDEYEMLQRSVIPNTIPFESDVDNRLCLSGFQQPMPHPRGLCPAPESFRRSDEALGIDGLPGRNRYERGTPRSVGVPLSVHRHSSMNEAFLPSQQIAVDLNCDLNALGAPHPSRAGLSELHYGSPMSNSHGGLGPAGWGPQTAGWGPQTPLPARRLENIEAFECEERWILPGKGLRFVGNHRRDLRKERKKLQLDDGLLDSRGFPVANKERSFHCPKLDPTAITSPLKYGNLMGSEGYIYYSAMDQHGCRFLQRKIGEGGHQVDLIFDGVIKHVAELMVNQFANYLIQKLLEACSEEQRTEILLELTKDPGVLVRISLNSHGTRAVQKLIGTLKTKQQIARVISALRPGFLNLMKDLNGNHVVQRCLQSFTTEDNKFIFDAAAKHCVDIATHRHGCCVLQRCIDHSTGEHRVQLVAEISANGFQLAQDAFGNYVVQYILGLKDALAIANLVSQFGGRYVQLSLQKFSSNVVEKCLKVFGPNDRAAIIFELLSVSQFEQLLQDPFANYVIQSALQISKGSLHMALVEAIRPHAPTHRTNPYCKRIFSRALPRK